MISIIAAIGKNNELGKENKLLWNLPADMKHFKEITSGHPVIMGRKTFESIGKPLPNRKNIVITRDKNYLRYSVDVVHSLEEAIKMSRSNLDIDDEIFIIGGTEIYKQAMEYANKLYITHISAEDKYADAFFPEIVSIVWNEILHEEHQPDEKNIFPYTFSVYERF
ncbi:MAG: dihydrofolate reductase [Patescibacteria group bacterium]